MKRAVFLASIIIFSWYASVIAEVTAKAEVNKQVLSLGEILTYKLTISSFETKISKPALPEFKDFRVISNAQSSSVSFEQGRAKSVLTYIFVLAPQEAGKFKIASASVKAGDKIYATGSFEIEVRPGKTKVPRLPEHKPSVPGATSLPQSQEPEITL